MTGVKVAPLAVVVAGIILLIFSFSVPIFIGVAGAAVNVAAPTDQTAETDFNQCEKKKQKDPSLNCGDIACDKSLNGGEVSGFATATGCEATGEPGQASTGGSASGGSSGASGGVSGTAGGTAVTPAAAPGVETSPPATQGLAQGISQSGAGTGVITAQPAIQTLQGFYNWLTGNDAQLAPVETSLPTAPQTQGLSGGLTGGTDVGGLISAPPTETGVQTSAGGIQSAGTIGLPTDTFTPTPVDQSGNPIGAQAYNEQLIQQAGTFEQPNSQTPGTPDAQAQCDAWYCTIGQKVTSGLDYLTNDVLTSSSEAAGHCPNLNCWGIGGSGNYASYSNGQAAATDYLNKWEQYVNGGQNTIDSFLNKWVEPGNGQTAQNDYNNYVSYVKDATGIGNGTLNPNDPTQAVAMMQAQARMEQGVTQLPFTDAQIQGAVSTVFGNGSSVPLPQESALGQSVFATGAGGIGYSVVTDPFSASTIQASAPVEPVAQPEAAQPAPVEPSPPISAAYIGPPAAAVTQPDNLSYETNNGGVTAQDIADAQKYVDNYNTTGSLTSPNASVPAAQPANSDTYIPNGVDGGGVYAPATEAAAPTVNGETADQIKTDINSLNTAIAAGNCTGYCPAVDLLQAQLAQKQLDLASLQGTPPSITSPSGAGTLTNGTALGSLSPGQLNAAVTNMLQSYPWLQDQIPANGLGFYTAGIQSDYDKLNAQLATFQSAPDASGIANYVNNTSNSFTANAFPSWEQQYTAGAFVSNVTPPSVSSSPWPTDITPTSAAQLQQFFDSNGITAPPGGYQGWEQSVNGTPAPTPETPAAPPAAPPAGPPAAPFSPGPQSPAAPSESSGGGGGAGAGSSVLSSLLSALAKLAGQQLAQQALSSCPTPPTAPTCAAGATPQPMYTQSGSNSCVSSYQCVGSGAAAASPTPTPQISCTPQVADVNESVSISYSCQNATGSSGNGFSTGNNLSGTASATIAAPPSGTNTANYALTCTNNGQTANAQCSIQINQPFIDFVASPATVAPGQTSTIGWTTGNTMQSCVVSSPDDSTFTTNNAGNQSTSGAAESDPITSPTTFILSCTTLGGTVETETTVVGN